MCQVTHSLHGHLSLGAWQEAQYRGQAIDCGHFMFQVLFFIISFNPHNNSDHFQVRILRLTEH